MDLSFYLNKNNILFEEGVYLSKKTWIKTGGKCAFWIIPISLHQLTDVCSFLNSNHIEFDIVGQTSNIFFHSTYNPHVVISTVNVDKFEIQNGILKCECGVSVIKLARYCLAEGYAGFYGLVGLPGTIGSAVVNNAGCFNCSISSMLISADVLMSDGSIKEVLKKDFNYGHRTSSFKRKEMKGVILSVNLLLTKASNIESEYRKSEETKNYRKTHQEGYAHNLGSVFSTIARKRNIKNTFISFIIKLFRNSSTETKRMLFKKMMLKFYGYTDLNLYISDKNMNTFIWRDKDSEIKFVRYKEFMHKAFDNLSIEIEEKIFAV